MFNEFKTTIWGDESFSETVLVLYGRKRVFLMQVCRIGSMRESFAVHSVGGASRDVGRQSAVGLDYLRLYI